MSEYYTDEELADVHCIGCGHPWAEKFGESSWHEVGHELYQCPRCNLTLSTKKPAVDILAAKDAEIAALREAVKCQHDLNRLRGELMGRTPEDCKDALIMQWPMIQGTANQFALKRIGDAPHEIATVTKALRAYDKALEATK